MSPQEILEEINRLSPEDQQLVFEKLAEKHSIHPLEGMWNVSARVILEAISRGSDLTQRGLRGIIAEASFKIFVLDKLESGWVVEDLINDYPYDYAISDKIGQVRIQVKMQRRLAGEPMMANKANRNFPASMFVVETQKTRAGKKGEENTRPYRFGEFDILAVSMAPSTGCWEDFMYTVANWLIPDPRDSRCILKFQPVPREPNDDWTNQLSIAIDWFRSGITKTIQSQDAGLI